MIGLSYCTCVFLVTRPFTWYHNVWPWSWTYFWKTLTLAITFKPEEMGFSYYTCVFLVTRLFTVYHNFWLCDLDLEVWPTFEKLSPWMLFNNGCRPVSVVVFWQLLFQRLFLIMSIVSSDQTNKSNFSTIGELRWVMKHCTCLWVLSAHPISQMKSACVSFVLFVPLVQDV